MVKGSILVHLVQDRNPELAACSGERWSLPEDTPAGTRLEFCQACNQMARRAAGRPAGQEALRLAVSEALERLREPCTPSDRGEARVILDRALRASAPDEGMEAERVEAAGEYLRDMAEALGIASDPNEGTRENATLRAALDWYWRALIHDSGIEYGDFFDEMTGRGLLVQVPADEAFREEWGDEAETMYVLRWHPAASAPSPAAAQPTFVEQPVAMGSRTFVTRCTVCGNKHVVHCGDCSCAGTAGCYRRAAQPPAIGAPGCLCFYGPEPNCPLHGDAAQGEVTP